MYYNLLCCDGSKRERKSAKTPKEVFLSKILPETWHKLQNRLAIVCLRMLIYKIAFIISDSKSQDGYSILRQNKRFL